MKLATKPSVWESLNKHCGGKLYPLMQEWVKAHPASVTPEKCDPEFFVEELAKLSYSQEKSPFVTSLKEWANANRHYQWLEIATDLSKTASRIAGYKFSSPAPAGATEPKLAKPEKPTMTFHASRGGSTIVPKGVPLSEFNYANPLNQGAPLILDVEVNDDSGLRFELQTDNPKLAKRLAALPHQRYAPDLDSDAKTLVFQTGIWIKTRELSSICYEISHAYHRAGLPRPEYISLKFSKPLICDAMSESFSIYRKNRWTPPPPKSLYETDPPPLGEM